MLKRSKRLLCFLVIALFSISSMSFAYAADNSPVIKYDFNDGKIGLWKLTLGNESMAFAKVVRKQLKVSIFDNGVERWDVQLHHDAYPLTVGTTYKVEFKVLSKRNTSIYAKIGDAGAPFNEVWNNNWMPIELKANTQTAISQTFTLNRPLINEEFAFHMGGSLSGKVPNDIYFDDISITPVSVPVPTPDPTPVQTPVPTPTSPTGNDIINYDFNDNDAGQWQLCLYDNAKATMSVENNELKVLVTEKGINPWDVSLRHQLQPLKMGQTYKIQFKMRSNKATSVYPKIGDTKDPYREIWNNNWFPIKLVAGVDTIVSQTFTVKYQPEDIELAFHMGGNNAGEVPCEFYFDDIKITSVPAPTPTPVISDIINYNFNNNDAGQWQLGLSENAKATMSVENNELKVLVTEKGISPWDVALRHQLQSLEMNHAYQIQFKVRSNKDVSVYPKIGDVKEPYREIWNNYWSPVKLTAGVDTTISQTFLVRYQPEDVELAFHMGGNNAGEVPCEFYFDDIKITPVPVIID